MSAAEIIETPAAAPLDLTDRNDLQYHEQVIEKGVKTFLQVGESLAVIRDRRLYRESYGTFEEYLDKRWDLKRARAYQLINAADVLKALPGEMSTIVDTESKARELAKVEPEKRAEVVEKAVEATGGKLTAKSLREAAQDAEARNAVIEVAREIDRERRKERKAEIEEQRERIAEEGRKVEPSHRWNVECRDLADYDPGVPVDVIVTDPPYPREYIETWDTLGRMAAQWLRPSGLLVAMSGQLYLPQVMERLGRHLDYYWCGALMTPGQATPLRTRNVNTNWKPLLVFTRKDDTYLGPIFGDVAQSDRNDKEHHKWGQSVSGMNSIMDRFAQPGQTVCDPFLGSGTTGVAALGRGCVFRGCDIEQRNVDIARARLGSVHDEEVIEPKRKLPAYKPEEAMRFYARAWIEMEKISPNDRQRGQALRTMADYCAGKLGEAS